MGYYTYPIATTIPGGQWMSPENPFMSDHLTALCRANIPSLAADAPDNQLFTIGSQVLNEVETLIIETVTDLTTEEQATLDGLVPRAADYFIVTQDGGVTDLGEPSEIDQTAGPESSVTITLKWKNGAGADSNGWGDTVSITPAALMPIDKTSAVFDENGKASFVAGASLTRGGVLIALAAGSVPPRNLLTKWS
jgi:hypothetical protein